MDEFNKDNKWYFIVAVYHAIAENRQLPCGVQRIVFLVSATSNEDALRRGLYVAKSKEHSYVNAVGENLLWNFVKIEEVKQLIDQAFKNGTEVYWSFIDMPDNTDTVTLESGATIATG